MRHLIIPALLLAAACRPSDAPPEQALALHSPGEAAVWQRSGDGLAFASPESDAFGLRMDCPAHGQKIELTAPTTVDVAGPLALVSGDARRTYPSWIASDGAMGLLLRAETGLADPVLAAFEASGAIGLADAPPMSAGSDAEREAISTFFADCRGGASSPAG